MVLAPSLSPRVGQSKRITSLDQSRIRGAQQLSLDGPFLMPDSRRILFTRARTHTHTSSPQQASISMERDHSSLLSTRGPNSATQSLLYTTQYSSHSLPTQKHNIFCDSLFSLFCQRRLFGSSPVSGKSWAEWIQYSEKRHRSLSDLRRWFHF